MPFTSRLRDKLLPCKKVNTVVHFFHTRTVHLDTTKVLLPTDAQNNCFKRILTFTLKQIKHVSVLSPSSYVYAATPPD